MFVKLLLIVATSFIAQGPDILPGTQRMPPQSSADMCKTGWGPDPTTGRYVFIIQISPNALAAFSDGVYGNDLVAKVPENLRPFIEETIVRIGTGALPQIPPTQEMRDGLRRLDQPTLTMLDERRGPVDIDRSIQVSGQNNLNNAAPILPPTNQVADNGFSNQQRNASDILPSNLRDRSARDNGAHDMGSIFPSIPTATNTNPNPYRPTTSTDAPSLDQFRQNTLANSTMSNGMPNNSGMSNNSMPNNSIMNNGVANNFGTNAGNGPLGSNTNGFPVSTNTNPQTTTREDGFRGNSVATNSMLNRMTGNTQPSVGSFSAPYSPNYSRTASNTAGSALTPLPVNPGFNTPNPAWGSGIAPNIPAGYDPNNYLAAANTGRTPTQQPLPGTSLHNGTGTNLPVAGGQLLPGQTLEDSRFAGTVQWLPFITIFLLVVNIYQFFWMAHVRTRYKEMVISKRNAQLNLAG